MRTDAVKEKGIRNKMIRELMKPNERIGEDNKKKKEPGIKKKLGHATSATPSRIRLLGHPELSSDVFCRRFQTPRS